MLVLWLVTQKKRRSQMWFYYKIVQELDLHSIFFFTTNRKQCFSTKTTKVRNSVCFSRCDWRRLSAVVNTSCSCQPRTQTETQARSAERQPHVH